MPVRTHTRPHPATTGGVDIRLPWWALTAAVSAISSSAALLLYEAVVRPTPLVRLFGPASTRPAGDEPSGAVGRPAD